jgi:penicillin-binding protein 1C
MGMIYPKNNSRIFIPVDLGGTPGAVVFQAAHRDPGSVIYWHLDENYYGMTQGKHQMSLNPPPGWHTLSLVDQQGSTMTIRFEVIGR